MRVWVRVLQGGVLLSAVFAELAWSLPGAREVRPRLLGLSAWWRRLRPPGRRLGQFFGRQGTLGGLLGPGRLSDPGALATTLAGVYIGAR